MKKKVLLLCMLPLIALVAHGAESPGDSPDTAKPAQAGAPVVSAATNVPAAGANNAPVPAETEAPAKGESQEPRPAPATPEEAAEPEPPLEPGMLRLNFRGVSLELVLDYLSEAAGYIINLQASPRGRVDVWSSTPVTKEEALNILDSVLRRNSLAAIRNGRTLTIVNRDEAKIHDIPVKLGSDPDEIPRTDEIVTQILPVRFVDATQLVRDLQPLVSVQTTMTANEAGNSIVITDTQANIRRVAEIIQAIDAGAEDVTEVRVFHLQNSDPIEVSELLTSLFPDESRGGTGGGSSQVQFGLSRFFGRGSSSSAGAPSSNAQSQRVRKRNRVLAVPDPRTSSLVVSAAKDLIPQIEAVVQELDASTARKQTVHMYQLENADPEEVQQVLQDMFERNSTSARSGQNRTDSTLRNRRTTQGNTTGLGNTRGGTTSRQGSTVRR